MTVLGTWCPDDVVLGTVAPLALAAAAGTALVIDVDPDSDAYPGAGTLAALVADGPTRIDLRPVKRGVAVLANGGITADDAAEVIDALAAGWPRVVLRHPARDRPAGHRVVPVHPLVPGRLVEPTQPAVYQRGPWVIHLPPPALVLPRVRPGTVRCLLEGRRPGPSRWLRQWRRVWDLPWP
ncbi:MAG: hypothetical protein H0V96_13160 [Acidimicrobiia bacterium]|nr:hypothetical protein [Acidimicrobiia bacterium]